MGTSLHTHGKAKKNIMDVSIRLPGQETSRTCMSLLSNTRVIDTHPILGFFSVPAGDVNSDPPRSYSKCSYPLSRLVGVSSVLPEGSSGAVSGQETWQQAPLPTGPSCEPSFWFCLFKTRSHYGSQASLELSHPDSLLSVRPVPSHPAL